MIHQLTLESVSLSNLELLSILVPFDSKAVFFTFRWQSLPTDEADFLVPEPTYDKGQTHCDPK